MGCSFGNTNIISATGQTCNFSAGTPLILRKVCVLTPLHCGSHTSNFTVIAAANSRSYANQSGRCSRRICLLGCNCGASQATRLNGAGYKNGDFLANIVGSQCIGFTGCTSNRRTTAHPKILQSAGIVRAAYNCG